MLEQILHLRADVRVWRDENMGRVWRVAYRDGDGETLVSFPDTAALGDFIADQFGLLLEDLDLREDRETRITVARRRRPILRRRPFTPLRFTPA